MWAWLHYQTFHHSHSHCSCFDRMVASPLNVFAHQRTDFAVILLLTCLIWCAIFIYGAEAIWTIIYFKRMMNTSKLYIRIRIQEDGRRKTNPWWYSSYFTSVAGMFSCAIYWTLKWWARRLSRTIALWQRGWKSVVTERWTESRILFIYKRKSLDFGMFNYTSSS